MSWCTFQKTKQICLLTMLSFSPCLVTCIKNDLLFLFSFYFYFFQFLSFCVVRWLCCRFWLGLLSVLCWCCHLFRILLFYFYFYWCFPCIIVFRVLSYLFNCHFFEVIVVFIVFIFWVVFTLDVVSNYCRFKSCFTFAMSLSYYGIDVI